MTILISFFFFFSNFSKKRKVDFLNFHFKYSISILIPAFSPVFPTFPLLFPTLFALFPAFSPWFPTFSPWFPTFPPWFPTFPSLLAAFSTWLPRSLLLPPHFQPNSSYSHPYSPHSHPFSMHSYSHSLHSPHFIPQFPIPAFTDSLILFGTLVAFSITVSKTKGDFLHEAEVFIMLSFVQWFSNDVNIQNCNVTIDKLVIVATFIKLKSIPISLVIKLYLKQYRFEDNVSYEQN